MSILKQFSEQSGLREGEKPFFAAKEAVMRGTETIARAKSATFAQRIANALNRYIPGSRGK